jgi:hypothetical protein
MTERGISFSAPMVRALLAGTKTQTRRVVKEKNVRAALRDGTGSACCPFHLGDRLWVREAYRLPAAVDALSPTEAGVRLTMDGHALPPIHFEADDIRRNWPAGSLALAPGKRRMGMFMPRWGSRILLEITDVRMERLDACSDADAQAEGIERLDGGWRLYRAGAGATPDARASYRSLWEHINGAGSWNANPLVWVIAFQRLPGGPAA